VDQRQAKKIEGRPTNEFNETFDDVAEKQKHCNKHQESLFAPKTTKIDDDDDDDDQQQRTLRPIFGTRAKTFVSTAWNISLYWRIVSI